MTREAVINRVKRLALLYNLSVDAYDELYFSEQVIKYASTLDLYNRCESSNCMDVGCGTGFLCRYISNNAYLIGLDISFKALKKAVSRCKDKICDFILCNGEKPPVRINALDWILLYTVIHHFQDIVRTFEVYSNVRRGIVVSILMKGVDYKSITNAIDKLLYTKGFSRIYSNAVYNDYILAYTK